jgi:hypothetical protein
LVAYCPLHGCQVLLGLTCIRRLANLAPGVFALELECYDGQQLVVLTGKRVTTGGEPGPAGTAAP